MSTNAEIQKRLRASEAADAAKAAAARKAAIEKKAAEDRARKAEADRQRKKYGKAANEAFEVWQQSPAGIATLKSQRAADKTRGLAGTVRGENQERAETDAQIERNRKAFVNARIARDVRNEGKPTGTNTSGSNRGSVPTNGSGKQGTGSGKQGTSTAAEPDFLKNPTAFKDKDRAATDFDKNNPFEGQNTTEDRTFSNNRFSAMMVY